MKILSSRKLLGVISRKSYFQEPSQCQDKQLVVISGRSQFQETLQFHYNYAQQFDETRIVKRHCHSMKTTCRNLLVRRDFKSLSISQKIPLVILNTVAILRDVTCFAISKAACGDFAKVVILGYTPTPWKFRGGRAGQRSPSGVGFVPLALYEERCAWLWLQPASQLAGWLAG